LLGQRLVILRKARQSHAIRCSWQESKQERQEQEKQE